MRSSGKRKGGRGGPRRPSTRPKSPPSPGSPRSRPPAEEYLDVRLGRAIERLVAGMPLWGWIALVGLAVLALASGLLALRDRRRLRRAQRAALGDPLTGLANRLAFDHQLAIAWERAKRYEGGLGVLVLDLDRFKQINDVGGHQAGDNHLREVGRVISSRARRSDMAARLGGDEFVVLSSGPGASGLPTLASDLRSELEQNGIEVSLGWAAREPNDGDPAAVLHRADLAMYEDKAARRAGRSLAVSPEPGRARPATRLA